MCASSDVMLCPACKGLAVTRGHMAVCTECWWLSPDLREHVAEEAGRPELVVCAEPDRSEDYARAALTGRKSASSGRKGG